MISTFDEYPIHQTSQPIAHPGSSDLNYYDRYWFAALDHDGEFMIEIAFGVYPNRQVADAALGISRKDEKQHSVLASRRVPADRGADTSVGPIKVHVIEPLRTIRVVVEANDTGVEADLTFRAANAAIEEPAMLQHRDGRLMMDTSRFTQFGKWEGFVVAGGKRTEVAAATTYGIRDRSWGIRPIGEPQPGVPGSAFEVFWIWAPVYFDDCCAHFGAFEDRTGHRFYTNAAVLPVYDTSADFPLVEEPGLEHMASLDHDITWVKGTRRAAKVETKLTSRSGEEYNIELEPLLRFYMQGTGYQHPEFCHGTWQGELAVRGESWDFADIDPLEPRGLHVQQLCRARMGGREGVGLCEQVVYGLHGPSGFTEFLDGAS